MAFTLLSSPFNVTWTVAITVFLLTLSLYLARLPPEIVVASYNTGLTVGALTLVCVTTFVVSELGWKPFAFAKGASDDNIIINESSPTEIFLEILTFSLNKFINFDFKFIFSIPSYFFILTAV